MTSFARVDVAYGAVLAFVRAADDLASGTVLQVAWLFGFHFVKFHGVLTRPNDKKLSRAAQTVNRDCGLTAPTHRAKDFG